MVVVVFFNCQYYCFIIFYKDHSLVFIVNPHGEQGDLSVPNSLPVRVLDQRFQESKGLQLSNVLTPLKYGQISLTLKCFTGH